MAQSWKPKLLATFKAKAETILKRAILSHRENKAVKLELGPGAAFALFALPTTCEDEDVEDWLQYIVDSLQFSGITVNCDEIDVDQVCAASLSRQQFLT